MEQNRLIQSLEQFVPIFQSTVSNLDPDDARWKPPQGSWSILEITCHLADEEVEDFRPRVQMTLAEPNKPWPPIDPPQAAIDRHYNDQELDEAAARFCKERSKSIDWLKSLPRDVDWNQVYQHPKMGPISAGQIMTAWAAHDWLHLRQIAKRRFEMVDMFGGAFNTQYAGEWTA